MAARTKQLAKDPLDEMNKPKSAEREAYEGQEEREDREALERFYLAIGQVKPEKAPSGRSPTSPTRSNG